MKDDAAKPGTNGRDGSRARWLWWVIGGSFLLVGGLAAVLLFVLRPEPVPAPTQDVAPLVETTKARAHDRPLQIEGHGVVQPRETLVLTAQVGGKITDIHPSVRVGGTFEADDVLVKIEPERHEAMVDRIRADVNSARASLALARTELRRTRSLHTRGYAPQAELDQNEARVDELKASIEALRAQLSTTRMDYQASFVTAPFPGRVLEESIAVGQVVSPGQALARVYPVDAYEVVVRLEDSEAALIEGLWEPAAASPVNARVLAERGAHRASWKAHVVRITGAYDEGAQTIGVVVRVPNPEPASPTGAGADNHRVPLMPGRFVTVHIEGRTEPGLLEIPRAALHRNDRVWELENRTLRLREVEVVHRTDENVYVRGEELSAGDELIVTDLPVVTDGLEVRVAPEPLDSTERAAA